MAYSINAKDHFKTHIYTGSGSAPNAQTGIGFQPDLVWIKPRNLANSNRLHTSILTAPDYYMMSENTDAEGTNNNSITSFDSDGFTLGNTDNGWNGSYNYVSWNWKAGTTSGISGGSVTPTAYSYNATSGFSVVAWNGAGATSTIPHGLGVAPKSIWIKKKSASGNNWQIYHSSLGAGKKLFFTTGNEVSSGWMNSTSPTSSVFTVINDADINASGSSYIAYCFAEKTGFSKIGSYAGHSSTQFLYLGFKPSWFMVKNANVNGEAWHLYDIKRLGRNPDNARLYPNSYVAEAAEAKIDLVSNGITIKSSGDGHLNNSNTFVYWAFAEAPLVGTNNTPCTAR